MDVLLRLVGVTRQPLNLTVLAPCVAPKLLPRIVTGMPTGPDDGVSVLIEAGGVTTTVVVEALQLLLSFDSVITAA
jgi:hypothetical protein